MARKQNSQKKIEYKRRLKELKQKLKPYRNSETVNLLRLITGSSGVNLNNYWESLESVLTGDYSHCFVKRRIQNVVNMITGDGENFKSRETHLKSGVDMVNKNLTHLNINLEPNVIDNVTRHVEIDSKANALDNVTHVEEIDSKANELNDLRHVNMGSKASVFDKVRHNDIDSKVNVFGNIKYGNINSNSNVFENVRHGDIDLKANVINRLRHLHIDSCKPACYERL